MNLNDPIFTDETKARAYFESIRWPHGVACPHCGGTERVYRLEGKSHRPGLFHCNDCSGSFTVTTGGVMESSHIPLTKWALAFRLYAASKKGFSANQLSRMLGITYKSAWFMAHRVREAMAPSANEGPVGGEGQIVEVDETEIGKSVKSRRKKSRNMKFVSLVERGGRVRSRNITNVQRSKTQAVRSVVKQEMDPISTLHTDSAAWYSMAPALAASHEAVNHEKEYVRAGKDGKVYTNSAEGYFSIFKRGLVGTYQIMSEQHLQRYLNEFDFRMSNRAKLGVNDDVRTERAIKGAEGKRLTYHQPN